MPNVVSKLFINGVSSGFSRRLIIGSIIDLTALKMSVVVVSRALKILFWVGV